MAPDLYPQDRIGKLIRLLSSDNPGEIAATVAALQRLIGRDGFHVLGALVDNHWPKAIQTKFEFAADPPPHKRQQRPRPEWQLLAEKLLRTHADVLIKSDKIDEVDFLTNVSRQRWHPSPAMEKWLNDIQRRKAAA